MGLLLNGIAGMWLLHWFYVSVSVGSDFENENAVLLRKRYVSISLKVWFDSKEGLRFNGQITPWNSCAEIEILVIYSTVCPARIRAAFLTRLCHIKPTFCRSINI